MMTRPNPLTYEPYLEALASERISRDAAVLGVRESIGGFPAVPLTLWHVLMLRIMRHPLIANQTPDPDQLRHFLWLLSPDYSPENRRGRKRHEKLCRKVFYPPRYMPLFNTKRARAKHEGKRLDKLAIAAKIIDEAKAFLSESMQDQPMQTARQGFQPDYYSDGVAFTARFARQFGWSPEIVMHMPIKVLFQYLNEMKIANGSTTPLCNPSDAVKAKFYRELNQSLAATRSERNAKLREATIQLRLSKKGKPHGR